VLRGVSRFSDVPDELHIELRGNQFVCLGTSSQVAHDEGRELLIAATPTGEAEAVSLSDLVKTSGVKRITAQRIIGEMNGVWGRIGTGKRGDPYRWFLNDKKLSAQTNIHTWAESNEGEEVEPHHGEF
jgi:hypothetical protein